MFFNLPSSTHDFLLSAREGAGTRRKKEEEQTMIVDGGATARLSTE